MADEGNEDSWLYGNEQAQAHFENEADISEKSDIQQNEFTVVDPKINDNSNAAELELDHADFEDAGEETDAPIVANQESDADLSDDDDDDDDDINVVIGDIKSGPPQSYTIKQTQRAPGTAAQVGAPTDKPKNLGGKFNIEEFESVGTINGTPAHEFNLESIEDKPWRKPGADITDYFNYGFNEDTWRAYCERQKKMRVHESGVGLGGLSVINPSASTDNKYGIRIPFNKAGMQPMKKPGVIDVIGGGNNRRDGPDGQMLRPPAPKENVIQVMTADRREYSRTVVGGPKFELPPPTFPAEEFYQHENDAFNYGYEPTQDSQWGPDNPWIPTNEPGGHQPPQVLPVIGVPMGVPPMNMNPGMGMRMPPPMPMQPMNPGMQNRNMMHPNEKDRERDERRDRERNEGDRRRYDRDRREADRERDERRERERNEEEGRRRYERERRDRDRERTVRRSRSRERSSRRERSRSRDKRDERERSSRREPSKERASSTRSKDKKKSHKKDKDEASD